MEMSVQKLFEMLDADAPVDISFPVSGSSAVPGIPESDDFRLFVRDSSQLTPDQFRMARSILRAAFKATNPDLFKGDDDK